MLISLGVDFLLESVVSDHLMGFPIEVFAKDSLGGLDHLAFVSGFYTSMLDDSLVFIGCYLVPLRQNTKVETHTNEERRRGELASPTLRHALQRNQRCVFTRVDHFTI
jgi:hypothetical protein